MGSLMAGNPVGDVQASRVFARHDGCPRGRADRAGRVAAGETHSASRKTVNVGRFVERAAVTAQIGPTHVIDEEENDVRGPIGGGKGCRKDPNEKGEG